MNTLARIAAAAAILGLSALPAAAQFNNNGFNFGMGTYAGAYSGSGVSGVATGVNGTSEASANAGGQVFAQSIGDPMAQVTQDHWGSAFATGQNAGADFFANGFGFGLGGFENQ